MNPVALALGVVGLISAVISLVISFRGAPMWGFIAAGAAVPFALGGIAYARSRRSAGGIVSGIAGLLAVLGIAVGLLGAMGIMTLGVEGKGPPASPESRLLLDHLQRDQVLHVDQSHGATG